MRQLTRRQLLALGAVGAGATAAGGAGLWLTTGTGSGSGYAGGEDLAEPQVLASRGGVLELDLTAAPARVRVGGREASVQAFNGSLPGPTLRVHAGDTIRITMRNGLQAPTNLHVHGLHVSPQGNSDNPFVSIDPGGSFDYEFSLPGDHPPGTYWYHPTATATSPTRSPPASTGPSWWKTPTRSRSPGTGCWWSPTCPSTPTAISPR